MSKQEISIYISKGFFLCVCVVDVLVFGFAFEKKISNLSKLKKERERGTGLTSFTQVLAKHLIK